MNKYNAPEFLPLVQALADGKTIQKNIIGSHDTWEDCVNVDFLLTASDYRIKPEPRTFEMWLFKPTGAMYRKDAVPKNKTIESDWERITVQEVLK